MSISKKFLEEKVLETINQCFEDEVEINNSDKQMINIGITNESKTNISLLKNIVFKVNDYIEIPIDGKYIRFDVKHVSDKKAYFVSHDILGASSMTKMDSFLDKFEEKLPSELLDIIAVNNQNLSGCESKHGKKVFLPSLANVGCDTNGRCCGTDDIPFDGFSTQADRCANLDGETYPWWLSTPEDGSGVVSAASFALVAYAGRCSYLTASHSRGVRPAFGISIS